MKSKFISSVTALAITLSLIPTTFAAGENTPLYNNWKDAANSAAAGVDYVQDGTSYTINTAIGLAWLANAVNTQGLSGNVTLAGDIDLSGVVDDAVLGEENSWIPIGFDGKKTFRGTFDGKGHTVSGLKIKSEEEFFYKGLFGVIAENGVVENVKIANSEIDLLGKEYNGEEYIPINHLYGGAIAGENNGTIRGCENSADISGTFVGGIAGINYGIIENCSNSGNLSGYEEVGGIAGVHIHSKTAPTSIANCENTGNIEGSFYIGGISGRTARTSTTNCINSGKITGQLWTGGITGSGDDGTVIDSCVNTGNIETYYVENSLISGYQNIGGIVGELSQFSGDAWMVKTCRNSGGITSKDNAVKHWSVGGIVGTGSGKGTIIDCVNSGDIAADNTVGGISGRTCGGGIDSVPLTVNCVNNGSITGDNTVGGISGDLTATVANSYNTGAITANETAGGIVGTTSIYGTSYSSGQVFNCYNVGNVTANKDAGSIIGNCIKDSVINCYYPQGQTPSGGENELKDSAPFAANGALGGGVDLYEKLNENVKTLSAGAWSFWLASQSLPAVLGDMFPDWKTAGAAASEGADYAVSGNTYTVYSPLGLAYIANIANDGDSLKGKTVLLNNDIDLAGIVNDFDLNDLNSWTPIRVFEGVFDGQNHMISGIKIGSNEKKIFGLFGEVLGEVRNLGVAESKINITSQSSGAGVIAGENKGLISNCFTARDVEIIATSIGTGGIVGTNEGTMENCSNAAAVTSTQARAGGITALNYGGTIKNSDNTGKINANKSYAGGIVGMTYGDDKGDAVILNCSNSGAVSSYQSYAGGICGNAMHSASSSAVIANSYNTGTVNASFYNAGGIAGSVQPSRIFNCYNAGKVTSTVNPGAIVGRLSNRDAKIENCYYLSSSAAKEIGTNSTTYIPVNCHIFDNDGNIMDADKTLCEMLNDGTHLLTLDGVLTWTEDGGAVKFGEVYADSIEISQIKLSKMPASGYIEGQNFNPAGMELTLLYSNNSQTEIAYSEANKNKFTFTPSLDAALTLSDEEVIVGYNGNSVSIPITVKAAEKVMTGITVSQLPAKTTYIEGNDLDLTGMTVTALYSTNEKETIDKYDVSGYDKTKTGNQNITVTFAGFTTSFTVTVQPKTVTGIRIITEPTNKEMIEGSALDTAGLVVEAQYDNNTASIITDYTISGYDKNTTGTQTITVSYNGKTAQFNIRVVDKSLIGITLDTSNATTSYIEAQYLNVNGLVVTAQYDNGTTEIIPKGEYTVSGYDRNKKGAQVVTISYEGYKAQYTVYVADKSLIGIKILLAPPKREYIEGEELDLTGLVMWAKYDNGTGSNIIGYTVTGYDKNKIGTQLVSVEYGGFTAEYTVNVSPKEMTALNVSHRPDVTSYIEGENLNLNGLMVTASYNNGTNETIYNYTVSGYDKNTLGKQTVTVEYNGFTASFDVTVASKELIAVRITKLPGRTNYVEGTDLDLSGMEVKAFYNNGSSEVIDGYSVSGYDKDAIGEQIVTVEYNGYVAKMLITVVDKSVTRIEITSEPTKTEYIQGQELELAGLGVTAFYNDGTETSVTGYDITGYDKDATGEQTVTVEYAEQTAQFTVNVSAKQLLNIMIIKLPLKTEYIEDETDSLDLTGISIIANYNNGIPEEISPEDCSISTFDYLAQGMQTIVLEYNGSTASFGVNVTPKKITQLSITNMPEQVNYVQGQALNTNGMIITVFYDNGKSEDVTEDITADDNGLIGYENNTVGRQTIVVSYGSMIDSFNVMVEEKTLTGINITAPSKTTYMVGEELDLSGMTVSAVYNNGLETDTVTEGYTVTGYDKNAKGTQTVTVEYEGQTAQFDVTLASSDPSLNATLSLDAANNAVKVNAAPELCEAGVVIVALYKDGVLVGLNTGTYDGTNAPAEISAEYTQTPDKATVMLWNSLSQMKAICAAESPAIQ